MPDGFLRAQFTHNVAASTVDDGELRRHLAAADSVALLLTAVHVTGDTSLLDRYGDQVGRASALQLVNKYWSGDARPTPVDSPVARGALIDLLCAALTREDQPQYLRPDRDLFRRMAETATGMHINDKQVAMCMEQSGFLPDRRAIRPTSTPSKSLNLAILGAGMTGLDAAVKATDRGFACTVYEKEASVGGLWWSQTYPGVAVDTPSVYYSLSYEITPKWSKFYPLGAEYRAYLTQVAEKYQLSDRIQTNSDVIRMEWLDRQQSWELTIRNPDDDTTRKTKAAAVVCGAGHLNRPHYPDIEGIQTFAGESVHTTRWRDVDLTGKRVAVVGVGAAGIQVIASIADKVEHLTVFQRQPHWVMPNQLGDGNVDESECWLRKHLPFYLQWSRFVLFFLACEYSYESNRVDEEWMKEHPMSISSVNEEQRRVALQHIHDCFGEGSELASMLTPDFPFGSKRPVRDPGNFGPGGYYWALSQEHVKLVTSAVSGVVPEGIVTADGNHVELDVIIWATGMTLDWLSPIEIIGRHGLRLSDVWANNDPRSYLGGTVPGFPNLFINDGPNTGVATGGGGHNFMTETVDHFAFECLQLMVERGATSIEVSQQAHDDHNNLIEQNMAGLLWSYDKNAHTYYRNSAGRIVFPSPFRAEDFWTMCQEPDESKFVLQTRVPDKASERRHG